MPGASASACASILSSHARWWRTSQGEPGALPLLSTALLELWQRREGRRLSRPPTNARGRARRGRATGEDAFRALDAEQQRTARHVLMALVAESETGHGRAPAHPVDELEIERSEDIRGVVEVLADRRLLTLSEGSVEIAHEALLREWPRLRAWIEEDRERIRIHRSLHAAAGDWLAHDRNEDWLYRGSHLLEARELDEQGALGLTGDERDFLAASEAYARRHRTARRRRLAIAFGALMVAVVALTLVAIEAIHQRRETGTLRNIALSRQLGLEAERLTNSDPELGVRLSLIALDTSPTDEAQVALRETTAAFYPYKEIKADSVRASTAAFNADGSRLVTGGADGVAIVWDAATHRRVASLDAKHDEVAAARFAPSGDHIALGFADGTVLVTDPSLQAPTPLLDASGKAVEAVAFSGDGRLIAAGLNDGTVRLLAADAGGRDETLSGRQGAVHSVDVNAAGTQVASAGDDGTVWLWDVADPGSGRAIHTGDEPERDVTFRPDGRQIMAVGDDGQIRVFDARTGSVRTDDERRGPGSEGRGVQLRRPPLCHGWPGRCDASLERRRRPAGRRAPRPALAHPRSRLRAGRPRGRQRRRGGDGARLGCRIGAGVGQLRIDDRRGLRARRPQHPRRELRRSRPRLGSGHGAASDGLERAGGPRYRELLPGRGLGAHRQLHASGAPVADLGPPGRDSRSGAA